MRKTQPQKADNVSQAFFGLEPTPPAKTSNGRSSTVAEERQYGVLTTADAKVIAGMYLDEIDLAQVAKFGLPEIDDRYHIWRVPIIDGSGKRLGEVVIDARTSIIDRKRTTTSQQLESRLLKKRHQRERKAKHEHIAEVPGGNYHNLRNIIACGESATMLEDLPPQSIDLVFTSPPYYNARIEYRDYTSYEEYLEAIRLVIRQCHRVLAEGRFFVMNVAPVLVRRTHRSEASQRLAVPFDLHAIFTAEGFDFIDDIHWVKPEGAGWATGRGRRFAADRNPLQYKAVPVTEYILVYRKQTERLIDWNIRQHPRQADVSASKIEDGYEVTNLWRIKPRHVSSHPAVFPFELANKVIQYYSFVGDVVLDPFAGSGTTGAAAATLKRKFVLIDAQAPYAQLMANECQQWPNVARGDVLFLNAEPDIERLF